MERVNAKGKILTTLESGRATMGEIIESAKLKHGTVQTTVCRLRDMGVVRVAGIRKGGGNRLSLVYELGNEADADIPWC
jgi:predicted transcriptional regulator